MGKRRQIPGKEYTFIKRRTGEEDTGILPQAYGESNDFVYWNPKKNFSLGGYWTSRKFKKDRSITDYRKRPEENKNNSKRWAAANPEKVRAAHQKHYKNNVEYYTIRSHYLNIFKRSYPAYKNLAFYDGWNPDKGGSFQSGADWIIENLGRRPDDTRYELHIIRRYPDPENLEKPYGFVPNNLIWIPKKEHRRQEMLEKILLENLELKNKLKLYEQ
jgi:hypothetical protein